ncbi:ADP-ribose glycohydrolase MACROD2 [Rhinophrynus dorsalis]
MYPSNKKKRLWKEEKERLLKMSLEERRKEYKHFVSLDRIPSLMEEICKASNNDERPQEVQVKNRLCDKVSLYKGDITQLEVDAIVNAANSSLLGGGGVDGCIHRASGPCLLAECRNLGGCETGQAKITCGYDLPAKYVIHTVGPIARGHLSMSHKEDLASCYNSSLKLAKEHNIRSIAFPCISTGIYGFPNEPAANIALSTVKEFLKKNHNEMDRIIFCVFLEVDYKIYKKKLSEFFPKDENIDGEEEDDEEEEEDATKEQGLEDVGEKTGVPAMKETENTQEMTELSQVTDEEREIISPCTSEEGTQHLMDKITEVTKKSSELKDEVSADEEMAEKEESQEQKGLKTDEAKHQTEDAVMESQDISEEDNTDSETSLKSPSEEKVEMNSQKESKEENQMSTQPPNKMPGFDQEEMQQDVEMNSQRSVHEADDGKEEKQITEKP